MDYIEIGSRVYRRVLVGMLLGSLVTFATLYCPQPLISLFSEQYHVSPSMASFTISFTTAALAIGTLFVSMFSNAWGRKGMMSISLLVTSVLAILSAFVRNFQVLLVIRLLQGFSIAGFPATAMAYLDEEISPNSLGGVMGMYIAGTAVGAFAGRVVIGTLTDLFSWHVALLALGVVSLLCSLWFWAYLPESRNFHRVTISFDHWAKGIIGSLKNRNLVNLYVIGFLLMGVYITLLNYIGYPLRKAPYELSQTVLGLLFVVNLIGTWSSVFFGRLADRYPRSYVIGGGILLLLIGALLTLNDHLVVKIIGLAVFVIGFFAGHSVASGWVGVVAPAENKAPASSLYILFYYSGSSLIGWSGGFFWSSFGWGGVISLICVLLGITALFSFKTESPVHLT